MDVQAQTNVNAKAMPTEVVSRDFKQLPIIDVGCYLSCTEGTLSTQNVELTPEALLECQRVAQCFHLFGICMIRDPRVNEEDNN